MTADTKVETLVKHISSSDGLTLVFVRTKRGADKLVRSSPRQDVSAVAMHGDMSQGARERALARFESGKVRTLVATDVAARGLDLDDITHVINFDPPGEDKDYVHRTAGPAVRDAAARRSRSSCPNSRPKRAMSPAGLVTTPVRGEPACSRHGRS